jgi:23S rRNA pseudouridine1911/1915/1917 synthase
MVTMYDALPMNAGFTYREIVDPRASGRPILDHLAERYRHSTRDEWRSRLADGRVLVDGRAAPADAVLRAGQCVAWIRPPWSEPDAPLAWAILHRDADVLAVAKPAGLPTIAGGGFLDHTLAALVARRHPGAAPVHRLDRGASGVVLFALSARGREGLARAFRENRVVKKYRALVDGTPAADAFVIDVPIARVGHPRLGMVHAAAPAAGGRAARTEVEVLERRGGTTLVAVRPITGRPHQIRIHLAAAGFALAGDPVYTAGGAPRPGAVAAGECGYHLHAERIEVASPGGSGSLRIWCAAPPALRRTTD